MSITKRSKKYKYDVYISYHPAQRGLVENFCNQVKSDNLNIWYDENNSSTFNVRALQSSAMFICFPSKEYKKSMKNRIEYSIALEQDMKIITMDEFLVESAQTELKSTEQKTNSQTISLDNNNENFINSFFKLVKNQTEIVSQKLYKFVRI